MERRDFFKLFGVGSMVVPLIGGSPEVAAPAKLIEVPKLEPVELAKTVPEDLANLLGGTAGMVVLLHTPYGHDYRIVARSVITSIKPTSMFDNAILPLQDTMWQLTGRFMQAPVYIQKDGMF